MPRNYCLGNMLPEGLAMGEEAEEVAIGAVGSGAKFTGPTSMILLVEGR